MPAQPIGDLGGGLRPPRVRGPPNSNNIVYNIVFSSEKKKKNTYIHIFGLQKRRLQKAHFSFEKKKNNNEARFSSIKKKEEKKKKPNAITVSLAW